MNSAISGCTVNINTVTITHNAVVVTTPMHLLGYYATGTSTQSTIGISNY